MELTGKNAIITGAASGIGRATCEALVVNGVASIAAVDRSAAVNDVCDELNRKAGRPVLTPYVGDVTSDEFRQSVFLRHKSSSGPLHLCIPAAGITRDALSVKFNRESSRVETYPRRDLEEVLEINLVAPILWAIDAVATVAEDRVRRGLKRWEPGEGSEGCIVLIGSVSSMGNKGQIAYATAKAGLEGAQATLAMEAIYYGVRCAIIHPGYTDTPMVRALGEEFVKDHILPQTQLRRLCRPSEIADGIVFMLKNSAVSGSLWVDAGWHPAA